MIKIIKGKQFRKINRENAEYLFTKETSLCAEYHMKEFLALISKRLGVTVCLVGKDIYAAL